MQPARRAGAGRPLHGFGKMSCVEWNVQAPVFTLSVLRFTDDVQAMATLLERLGLKRVITSSKLVVMRAGAGIVGVHAASLAKDCAVPGQTRLVFDVDDAQAAADYLSRAGLKTTVWDEPYGRLGGVLDPAGRGIWIQEFNDDFYDERPGEPDPRIFVSAVRRSRDVAADTAFFEKLGYRPGGGAGDNLPDDGAGSNWVKANGTWLEDGQGQALREESESSPGEGEGENEKDESRSWSGQVQGRTWLEESESRNGCGEDGRGRALREESESSPGEDESETGEEGENEKDESRNRSGSRNGRCAALVSGRGEVLVLREGEPVAPPHEHAPLGRDSVIDLRFETTAPLESIRDRLNAAGYPARIATDDARPRLTVTDPDGCVFDICLREEAP